MVKARTDLVYDFDTVVDRRKTNSVKWDFCDCCFGTEDLLPMWVADMDFRGPAEVVEAVEAVARHGIYGYSDLPESYFESIIDWASRHYNLQLSPEMISYTPGVITGLNVAIQTFTHPGDKVVIQPPVYPPFYSSVRNNGRVVVENTLVDDGSRFVMDLDGLEASIDRRTKMIALCSPHNPIGRVWSRGELEALAEIVLRHDLLVFSDEIHADIVYEGKSHISFASLGPELEERTITGFAPSKTFNIAGLKASVIATTNPALKREFDQMQVNTFGLYNANVFAITALEVAYRFGEPWLQQVRDYLHANARHSVNFINSELPGVRVYQPDGTFLLWLDFSSLGLSQEQLRELIFCEAKVGLNDGLSFGPVGQGHMRLNFGCARSVLDEGLGRLREALR